MTMANSGSTVCVNIGNESELNKPSTSKQLCNTSGNACANISSNISSDLIVIDSDSDSDNEGIPGITLDEDVPPAQESEQMRDVPLLIDVSKLQAFIKESRELEVLFKNHLMEPLTFLLLLHDFALEMKLSKIIKDCGGWVYKNVSQIDAYTAVLVKDDSTHWSYIGAVFKLSYLQACIQSKKILDISQFFRSSAKLKVKPSFNFMNVIYFKRYSWNTIPDKYITSPNKWSLMAYVRSELRQNLPTVTRVDDVLVSSSDEDIVPNTLNAFVSPSRPRKNTKALYDRKEDEDILKYIVKHEGYYNVKGTTFWKTMENRNICPNRTWQSLKEHFLKKTVYKLSVFKFLTNKQVKLLEACVVQK